MGVCSMGIDHPKGIIKNIVPIVMAGVLGIYGLIVAVIITQAISQPGGDGYNTYSVYNGFTHVSWPITIPSALVLFVNCLDISFAHVLKLNRWLRSQFAAGMCCGISCLAAGGTIGILGDVGVRAFGLKAERGRKWYWQDGEGEEGEGGDSGFSQVSAAEVANKLYVGMLIMLIFSEALAL